MNDPIPAFDYRRQWRAIRSEIEAAIERVLESGQLILGPEVERFEAEFAAYVGADHAVATASGTDALILALRVLGVGRDDEVITVANTAVATAAALRAVGAMPRLVDVRPDTLQMDPDRLAAAVSPRTRCIVPVHLYGHPVDLDPVLAIARRSGLAVLEDCAQAHGARYHGRHVGTFGQIGCFSFYPTKNLGAFGDGGMCVTQDRQLADALRKQRMYGFDGQRIAQCEGLNSRLDELQAAMLRVKLKRLDEALDRRARIAAEYQAGLADTPLVLPVEAAGVRHAWHLFVVRADDRAATCRALEAARIGYGIHYPVPIHRMPAYAFLAGQTGELPVTERAARQVLSLPLFPELQPSEVQRVIHTLRAAGGDVRASEGT